jgi:hypothetical protein
MKQRNGTAFHLPSARRVSVRSALVFAAMAALPAGWLGVTRAPVKAAEGKVRVTGDVRLEAQPPCDFSTGYACSLQIYAEPANRLLYAYQPRWLAVYDLDSLRQIASLDPGPFVPTLAYPDALTGDLIMAAQVPPGGVATAVRTADTPALKRFGLRGGRLQMLGSADLSPHIGPSNRVLGGFRAGTSSRFIVLTSPSGAGLSIAELDIASLDSGAVALDWVQDLSHACVPISHAGGPAGLVFAPETQALYFGCGAAGVFGNYQAPEGAGVGKLSLNGNPADGKTAAGAFQKFVHSGDFTSGDSAADPVSGRVLITGFTSGAGAVTAYVFDGRIDRYVGQFGGGATPFAAVGFDSVRGRFYGHSQQTSVGLVASDLRPTPVSLGLSYPVLATRANGIASGGEVVIDPPTHRVFLRYSDDASLVRVVVDDEPTYLPPADPDPDASTTNIEEVPGKTNATFSGSVQGYGVRYRSLGGAQNLVFNVIHPLNPGDADFRELRGAYVNDVLLANEEASASVIASDADDTTKSEFGGATPWPYSPAQCSDFGNSPQKKSAEGSEVDCAAKDHVVRMSSTIDETGASGFSVQRAATTAEIKRDPLKGMVSTITSSASGIAIGVGTASPIHIGQVLVRTTAYAKGRPGTARSTFERTVSEVTVGDNTVCPNVCDKKQLAALLNTASAGRIRIELPEPDKVSYPNGSRGGYQSIVRRDQAEQLEAMYLENQAPDRLEVPGMVVTLIGDSDRTSRLVMQLAGTEAEARYGISGSGGDTGGGGLSDSSEPLALFDPTAPALDGTGGAFGDVGTSPSGALSGAPGIGSSLPGGSVAAQVGKLIVNGLRRAGALFPVWAVLLAPIYLSARRWLLLERQKLVQGGQS